MTKKEFVQKQLFAMNKDPKWKAHIVEKTKLKYPDFSMKLPYYINKQMIEDAEWLWEQEQKKQQGSGVIIGGGSAIPKPNTIVGGDSKPPINKLHPPTIKGTDKSTTEENEVPIEKKILGMPKKVAIPVLIVGGIIVLYVGYKVYKKYKK